MASAISGYITQIQNAIYGEQVRGAIINAITRCYDDVNSPTLTQEAFTSILSDMATNGSLADAVLSYYGFFTEETTNKFNLAKSSFGKVLNTTTGELRDNANYFTSDWIPVNEGDLVFFDNCSVKVFYNANKQFVEFITSYISGQSPYTVPSGGGYIRASAVNANRNTVKINIGERVAYVPGISSADYNFRENVNNLITLSAEEKAALIALLN